MIALLFALFVQEAAVSADHLREYEAVLASDEMAGRLAGTEGNDRAAAYIADRLREWGIEPAGELVPDLGIVYFQRFNLPHEGWETRNVLGMIRGTDPEVGQEIVVVGAHMDHAGTADDPAGAEFRGEEDPEDRIWNGADDNASGSSTVLEVARVLAASGVRPRRTILFMWFSAEEWGLNGSRHYVENPTLPLDRHVAMINLDMVGRSRSGALSVGGVGTSEAWADLVAGAAEGLELDVTTGEQVHGGSDHASFAAAQVPAVHLFTGFHAQYHRPGDHADLIEYDTMAEIARFTVRLTLSVADRTERLVYRRPPRGSQLGIRLADVTSEERERIGLAEDRGALRVTHAYEGFPAAEAGVRVDDIIVEFGGSPLPTEETERELRRRIREAARDEDVPIVIYRGAERVELAVRFD